MCGRGRQWDHRVARRVTACRLKSKVEQPIHWPRPIHPRSFSTEIVVSSSSGNSISNPVGYRVRNFRSSLTHWLTADTVRHPAWTWEPPLVFFLPHPVWYTAIAVARMSTSLQARDPISLYFPRPSWWSVDSGRFILEAATIHGCTCRSFILLPYDTSWHMHVSRGNWCSVIFLCTLRCTVVDGFRGSRFLRG